MMKSEEILNILDSYFKEPKLELKYNKDYELLLSVMLSAQTTDKRVNMCTLPLYKKYNTLEKLSKLSIKELEIYLKPIGMYKQKSKYFKDIVDTLLNYGYVPNDRKIIESMSGVGRKTANVVLAILYNVPSIAVDTHVSRVSKRLGLVKDEDDVLTIEKKLMKKFKKEDWIKLHLDLVLFGRYYCLSKKPLCNNCKFKNKCKYYKKVVKNK